MAQFQVFLCRTEADVTIADSFRAAVVSGWPVGQGLLDFVDCRNWRPGHDWTAEQENAIAASHVLVALLTENFWRSNECRKEVELAIALRKGAFGPAVLPVRLMENAWPIPVVLQPKR